MAHTNPFLRAPPQPGSGEVHLTLLPPANPNFKTLTYTYPLKLVPSAPHILNASPLQELAQEDAARDGNLQLVLPKTVPLLFLLSYGGGVLPPDAIDLTIRLDPNTRLTIATQGSTKIFPSSPFQQPRRLDSLTAPIEPASDPARTRAPLPTATQTLTVHLAAHAALCLTPDPTQPFQGSKYHQRQTFTVHPKASLLLLDWTSEGRRARGEHWHAHLWRGCNEIWRETSDVDDNGKAKTRLQLRDQVILEDDEEGPGVSDMVGSSGYGMRALREQGMGCFGTLVAVGSVVQSIGDFFVEEFEQLPRVGGRDWGDEDNRQEEHDEDDALASLRRRREDWRQRRLKMEKEDGLLWTSARVRGLVLIKFAARELLGARRWLREMLVFEGTVAREFGEGGLLCVK